MPERAILYLAIGQTLIWASASYIFPALLLWWEQDLGWQRTELTGAFTLALLVSALCSPIVGRIIDQGRGPELMGLTTAGAGVLVGLLSLVTEIWQFYTVWVLIGVMISGCLYEPCFAIITRARGLNAKRSIVVVTLLAGFASTISFPMAHELAGNFGWRMAVIVFCMIAVFIAAPLMFLGARDVEHNKQIEPALKSKPTEQKTFLKRPEFWFLGLAFALGSHLQQITIHHLLAILTERHVLRDVAVLAASFIGPMQVAGRIAMVAAEKYASNHHLVAILSFSAMGLSAVMLMLSGSGVGFIAGFAILFGGAHGVVSIIRPMLAWQILGEENFGAKSGYLASMFFIGGALAPFTGSIIWEQGGYDTVLVFLILLAAGGLCLYLAAQRFSQKSEVQHG